VYVEEGTFGFRCDRSLGRCHDTYPVNSSGCSPQRVPQSCQGTVSRRSQGPEAMETLVQAPMEDLRGASTRHQGIASQGMQALMRAVLRGGLSFKTTVLIQRKEARSNQPPTYPCHNRALRSPGHLDAGFLFRGAAFPEARPGLLVSMTQGGTLGPRNGVAAVPPRLVGFRGCTSHCGARESWAGSPVDPQIRQDLLCSDVSGKRGRLRAYSFSHGAGLLCHPSDLHR
jgi:hypothetical protein